MLASGVALAVTKHCGSRCSGTQGSDTLLGDERYNSMKELRGNEILKGFGKTDDLTGGADTDVLYGHARPKRPVLGNVSQAGGSSAGTAGPSSDPDPGTTGTPKPSRVEQR